jgi:hypothetical protein
MAADLPGPESDDWADWQRLLANQDFSESLGPASAMVLDRPDGFATRSSALIALPAYPGPATPPRWLHAEGRPDRVTFLPVSLDPAVL